MKVESINSFSYKNKLNSSMSKGGGKNFGVNTDNVFSQNPIQDKFENSNSISFGSSATQVQCQKKYAYCRKKFTPETDDMMKSAANIARKYGSNEIKEEHLFVAGLLEVKKFIEDLDNGASYDTTPNLCITSEIEDLTVVDVLRDSKKRAKIKPVINKHIKKTLKTLKKEQQNKKMPFFSKIKPSFSLMQSFVTSYEYTTMLAGSEPANYNDSLAFKSLSISRSKAFAPKYKEFKDDLLRSVMESDKFNESNLHLKFYDDKADKLWKNLDLGNDMFVVYDENNTAAGKHLISSFKNLIQKKDVHYKNLNKDNTKIIIYNDDVNFELINSEVEKAKKDKDHTYIYVVPFAPSAYNTGIIRGATGQAFAQPDLKTIKNAPENNKKSNYRIVFVGDKDTYYINLASLKKYIGDYGQLTIPMVNVNDAKEILTDEDAKEFLENMTKKPFDKEAIEKSIEIANSMEGYFPEKAIQLMTNIATYYVDKERITIDDVTKYIEETRELNKTSESDSEFKINFNTGKTLKDIVGSPMTKAEAQSVVDQIKHKTVGTKGMTVFLDNGSSYGGGRHHTAEAIAGEAGIPMITINARDFALKDIDALAQNAGLSELKIKKLVSMAKSQAEANINNTAMIFIENFDNFGSDPVYGLSSIYEQKAFSQLLREMENVRKNDNVNILIVGSVNRPELLDEDIMKPYKFLDKIIIYSPQDTNDRIDILNYYIKKENLKIAGSKEERQKIIKNISETTDYFSVVDLMYLLDKANNISKERGKKAIDKSDFTEAFLQTTTGRVSTKFEPMHNKEIVAAHECGHAITLHVMHELAKRAQKPWHLPNQVNFITLDPRGRYGGATFAKDSDNHEYSFEKIFTDLVFAFGGHSAEKKFYNMDGSWGITGDMGQVTNEARQAVEIMGMGPKTGKIAIQRNGLGLADVSERLRNNIDDDIEVFLKNSKYVSDRILEEYGTFVQEFAENYKEKVGTGDCIVTSEEFIEQFENWKLKEPKEKIEKLESLDKEILEVIEKTKKGEIVDKK